MRVNRVAVIGLLAMVLVGVGGRQGVRGADTQPGRPAAVPYPGASRLKAAVGLVPAGMPEAPKELQLQAGQTIVAIGDSITRRGRYLRYVDQALAQQYPGLKIPKMVDKGIGSQKAEAMAKRFDRDVVALKPAVVTINAGINDVAQDLKPPHDDGKVKAFKESVDKMVGQAQAAGIEVILLAPTIFEEDPQSVGNQRLTVYVEAMRQVAAEKKCSFVDLHAMFLAALAKKPADAKGYWLLADAVHMNPLGDAIMAVGVLRALGVPDGKIAATVLTPPPEPASAPTSKGPR